MISQYFTYDGIDCREKGLYIIRTEGGMFSVPYSSSKEILEDFPPRAISPYFFGVQHQPLSFPLKFSSLDNNIDNNKLYNIAKWLIRDRYLPFISSDNPDKIFYCMAISDIQRISNGAGGEYFEIQFRCRDAFAYTPPIISPFDLSDNTATTTIQLENKSNIDFDYFYPILEFTLVDNSTGISLKNLNDNGRTFSFSTLNTTETIYVDNQKRVIISNTGSNRLSKFNLNWFRLNYGVNNIVVTGQCILQFKMEFPVRM